MQFSKLNYKILNENQNFANLNNFFLQIQTIFENWFVKYEMKKSKFCKFERFSKIDL